MTRAEAEELLGLKVPYTKPELRKAIREAMRMWHPDRASQFGIPADLASENFASIQPAEKLLMGYFDGKPADFRLIPDRPASSSSGASSSSSSSASKSSSSSAAGGPTSRPTGETTNRRKRPTQKQRQADAKASHAASSSAGGAASSSTSGAGRSSQHSHRQRREQERPKKQERPRPQQPAPEPTPRVDPVMVASSVGHAIGSREQALHIALLVMIALVALGSGSNALEWLGGQGYESWDAALGSPVAAIELASHFLPALFAALLFFTEALASPLSKAIARGAEWWADGLDGGAGGRTLATKVAWWSVAILIEIGVLLSIVIAKAVEATSPPTIRNGRR